MAEKEDDDGMYQHSGEAGPGLDMKHGFVNHIRTNQINRDDYDKEVRLAKLKQRPKRRTPASNRPKKPDMNRYMPPTRKPNDVEGERPVALDKLVLFTLEYVDENGEISKSLVLKDDDPYQIASDFGQDCGITEPSMLQALGLRIEQEMKKRGV